MIYLSFGSIACMCLFISIYFVLPKKIRWIELLLSNYVIYFMVSGKNKMAVLVLFMFTVFVYTMALLISLSKKKYYNGKIKKIYAKILLAFSIVCIIAMMIIVKIYFRDSLFYRMSKTKKFILLIGVSYFSLQAIGYLIDIYKEKYEPERNIGKMALFLSFYPCILQGPVGNYNKVIDNLYKPHKFDFERFKHGAIIISVGVIKKIVVADRILIGIEPIINDYTKYSGYILFLCGFLYMIELYTAIVGVFDISRGIAKIYGIEIEKNYNNPFLARSIKELFERWNITLTNWVKEYTTHAIFGVCMFIALWHGFKIKFVILGIFYFILIQIGKILGKVNTKICEKRNINKDNIIISLLQMLKMWVIIFITMLVYRINDIRNFVDYFTRMFKLDGIKTVFNQDFKLFNLLVVIVFVISFIVLDILEEKKKDVYNMFIDKRCFAIKFIIYFIIAFAIIILGVYDEKGVFLYNLYNV